MTQLPQPQDMQAKVEGYTRVLAHQRDLLLHRQRLLQERQHLLEQQRHLLLLKRQLLAHRLAATSASSDLPSC